MQTNVTVDQSASRASSLSATRNSELSSSADTHQLIQHYDHSRQFLAVIAGTISETHKIRQYDWLVNQLHCCCCDLAALFYPCILRMTVKVGACQTMENYLYCLGVDQKLRSLQNVYIYDITHHFGLAKDQT